MSELEYYVSLSAKEFKDRAKLTSELLNEAKIDVKQFEKLTNGNLPIEKIKEIYLSNEKN